MKQFFAWQKEKWSAFLQREREMMKDMTGKEKILYILGAFRLEICLTIIGIAALVGIVILIDNRTNTQLIYAALVDSSYTAEQCNELGSEFKNYYGDDNRKHVVYLDNNVTVLGTASNDNELTAEYSELYEYQQKSMILVGTGLVDFYVCNDQYMAYLEDYDDVRPVSEVLSGELYTQFSNQIIEDRYIALTAEQAAVCGVEYDNPCLVFTWNTHFPEAVNSFASFILNTIPEPYPILKEQ